MDPSVLMQNPMGMPHQYSMQAGAMQPLGTISEVVFVTFGTFSIASHVGKLMGFML